MLQHQPRKQVRITEFNMKRIEIRTHLFDITETKTQEVQVIFPGSNGAAQHMLK